jgi:hypothetical protein
MAPDYPADWHPLSNDAADSSWRGSPMSMFAKGGRVGAKPFEIKVPREHTEKMAKGGLAGQAKNVADAGVGGDTMVIHINKDEYQKLCKEWGEPTINPHTGMPQFTPFYKQSWFAPVAALAGTALMATGVGAGIGGALLGEAAGTIGGTTLAGATGIGALGSTTVGTLAGNALLSAGIGGLTGGAKGALTSGLLGAAGTVGASALGNYLGSGAAATPTSVTTGTPGGVLEGAAGYSADDLAYLNAGADKIMRTPGNEVFGGNLVDKGMGSTTFDVQAPAAASKGSGLMSGLTGYLTDPNKMAAAAVGLGALAGGGGGTPSAVAATPASTATDPNLTRHLDTTPQERIRLRPPIDYYKYGFSSEPLYYAPQAAAQQPATPLAHGGPLSRAVTGPGTGRSDSIDAKLSDGEYVIDAETVALLGDGSSKAGAAKLDQFRANIRKQKGKALSKGKISPDAESPDRYLMGGRA